MKDNFEDLLTAMRVELEQLRNERDQLRDRPRGPAPGTATPDSERLLGEIEALKIENASLAQLQGGRFASIAEEDGVGPGGGLSRSTSARVPSKSSFARPGSLSRSNSVSAKERENRGSFAEQMKDVEAQRDALHQSLNRLLDRQAYQTREHEKRARIMELELSHARQTNSPRKLGYERDVRNMREEVNYLRQRAQGAMDQKWQCEKGLASLKMDLDRAEQETTSLRVLLQEDEVSLPEEVNSDRDNFAEVLATSSSLETASQQLQLDREHAQARSPAEPSSELTLSIERTELLAHSVRQQLENNNTLRNRLADAIGKGEQEQQISATRINELQSRLKELEDNLLAAQQHSEDEMTVYEEDLRDLNESQGAQLVRVKGAARSPRLGSGTANANGNAPFVGDRVPRVENTTSGQAVPLAETVQAEVLERRVKDLERLLRDADMDMEEVVGRMNRAQVKVAELQSDRYVELTRCRLVQ